MRNSREMIGVVVLLATMSMGQAQSGQAGGEPLASHTEKLVIGETPETAFGSLNCLRLNSDGLLLAGDATKSEIRLIDMEGKTAATWKTPVKPHALFACDDGTVYVGGQGELAKLDREGKVVATVRSDGTNFPRSKASGIAVMDQDVFISFGSGGSLSAKAVIIRFNRDLGEPKEIARDLRGCCQRMDLVARDKVLYAAENARFRVVKFDRDGKELATWGQQDRKSIEGFGACCNPMNLCFGPDGSLYTSESGLGRIKRYDADGKFLGLVGHVAVPRFERAGHLAASCSNIAIAVSKDGKRAFVQDVAQNVIRVLVASDAGGPSPATQPQVTE